MRKHLKKPILFLLIAALSLTVFHVAAGCSGQQTQARIRIITTVFAPYDFAREVCAGIEDVEIKMLLSPGEESHTYEPSPQDIVSLSDCDLFVYSGGENDTWVNTILNGLDNKNLRTVVMTECAELVEEEFVEGMEHEEEQGEEKPEYDVHVWTSLRNAQAIVAAISEALQAADPEYAEVYRANAEAYNMKLAALDAQFAEMIEHSARKTIVVADRFPLRYFADDYGLNYYAAFPGCAEESEASPQTVIFLHNKVIELGIPVVFTIEFSNQQIARTVIEGTNAHIKTFYTCHNVTAEDFAKGTTYYQMMQSNYESLREALN